VGGSKQWQKLPGAIRVFRAHGCDLKTNLDPTQTTMEIMAGLALV
jgi:hypothetical protein